MDGKCKRQRAFKWPPERVRHLKEVEAVHIPELGTEQLRRITDPGGEQIAEEATRNHAKEFQEADKKRQRPEDRQGPNGRAPGTRRASDGKKCQQMARREIERDGVRWGQMASNRSGADGNRTNRDRWQQMAIGGKRWRRMASERSGTNGSRWRLKASEGNATATEGMATDGI